MSTEDLNSPLNQEEGFSPSSKPSPLDDSASELKDESAAQILSLMEDDQIDHIETKDIGNCIAAIEKNIEDEKIKRNQATKLNAPSLKSDSSTESEQSSPSNSHSHDITEQQQQRPTLNSSSSKKENRKLIKFSKKQRREGSPEDRDTHNNNNNNNSHSKQRAEHKLYAPREPRTPKGERKSSSLPSYKSVSRALSVNNNSDRAINFESSCETDQHSSESQNSISSTKECGTTTSIGTITDPDCLGPCEPGTSVRLEGIVWQETDGGILVVNVTWRGKSYVGSLLDCTKHDWAPPRLCDSPTSDIDVKSYKGARSKRIVTRSNGMGVDEKNLLQTTGKLRNGKGRRLLNDTESSTSSANKKQKDVAQTINANESSSNSNGVAVAQPNEAINNSTVDIETSTTNPTPNTTAVLAVAEEVAEPNSPALISCTEPDCSKKYRSMNGLSYHRAHAHGNSSMSTEPTVKNASKHQSYHDKARTSEKSENQKRDDLLPMTNSNNIKKESDFRSVSPSPSIKRPRSPSESPNMSKETRIFSPMSRSHNIFDKSTTDRRDNQPPPLPPQERHINDQPPRPPKSSNPDQIQPTGSLSSTNRINNTKSNPNNNNNSNNNNNGCRPTSLNPPPPLNNSLEEGMKPSGVSTGPPPAPHAANYYLNSLYGNPLNSFPFGSVGNRMQPPPLPTSFLDPSMMAVFTRLMAQQSRLPNPLGPPQPDARLPNPVLPPPPFPSLAQGPPMPGSLPRIPSPPMSNQMSMPPLPNSPAQPQMRHLRLPSPPTHSMPFSWSRLP